MKSQISYLEKLLSGELKDQESYYYYIENILQKNIAMNEELNGQLEVSLQENKELRSKNLLLVKRLQKKEVIAKKNIKKIKYWKLEFCY